MSRAPGNGGSRSCRRASASLSCCTTAAWPCAAVAAPRSRVAWWPASPYWAGMVAVVGAAGADRAPRCAVRVEDGRVVGAGRVDRRRPVGFALAEVVLDDPAAAARQVTSEPADGLAVEHGWFVPLLGDLAVADRLHDDLD